ncbi:uncharacterized protein BCR38DRAFT_470281 [Pseudomassariella vexata]|uniref:Uncharacterized protein n=1 Tax=Pseudomassariella vexata TaxID=1141098 RepID=A0A1Y2EI72_9PEZI|nr:uncharacterized protein BCR38DRAFT_470281 [Pseudomassariella vexata]ORY71282.1 hypothetical protein BCR38DRAFT_470281 [Pseudomassariella vexata]
MDSTTALRAVAANIDQPWDHHVYDVRSHEQATIDDAVAVFESILEPLQDLESDEVSNGSDLAAAEGEISQLTLISSERNNNKETLLTAETFIWVPQMPEYPMTSETGVCYVISARGQTKEQARSHINEIQFCHGHKTSWRQTTCAFLDNAICNRVTYKCTGVKACEYLSPALRNRSYTEVSENEWDLVATAKQEAERAINDQVHYQALCFLYAEIKLFEDGKLCKPYENTCKLEIIQDGKTISGVPRHTLRCIHSRPHSETPSHVRHHWKPIPREYNPAIILFQAVLNNTLVDQIQPGPCYHIAQNKKLAKLCPIVHPQGKGKIIELSCQCEYDFYIPLDLDLHPYVLCVCHGTHRHPIPPPSKLGSKLYTETWDLIQRIADPRLRCTLFLKNPIVQTWIRSKGATSLVDLHPALINSELIGYIIRKHRMIHFAAGSGLMAVQRAFERENGKPGQYIQEVFQNSTNFMVICFNNEQFHLFKSLRTCTIDMNYKHLIDREDREVIWAVYDEGICRNVALVRVITNSDSIKMYHFMFHQVFRIMREKFNYEVSWAFDQTLGSAENPFIGFTTDQDYKLIIGLGMYLYDKFQQGSWLYYVKSTIRYCKVHFQRGVEKITGVANRGPDSDFSRMMELLHMQSEEDYNELCRLLSTNSTNPKLRAWALHKVRPAIKCGVNQHFSWISSSDWDKMAPSTNPAEVQHQRSYHYGGRYQYVADCVENNRQLDEKDFESAAIYKKFNIPYAYRPASIQDRYARSTMREITTIQKRRRETESFSDFPIPSPSPTFDYASSSNQLGIPSSAVSEARELSQYSSSGSARSGSLPSRSKFKRHKSLNPHRTQNTSGHAQDSLEARFQAVDILRREEEARALKLQNDEKELELEERRRRLNG